MAKAAGVSPATVSRALGVSELVTPATRERVRAVAARLGYAPNRAARGLITGRTGNVGLVVPDLLNPIFPSVIKAIQARGRETDYAVFIWPPSWIPPASAGGGNEVGGRVGAAQRVQFDVT
ncbi:LacI family DNA-binding transcriptional regulator [Streptomyces hirsutus]|uniref:LacI family DNA-binding transcriptional regulator n=1 Tax=Streptomyces hirsutus TaxID=35620 RepID=UPI0036C3BD6C